MEIQAIQRAVLLDKPSVTQYVNSTLPINKKFTNGCHKSKFTKKTFFHNQPRLPFKQSVVIMTEVPKLHIRQPSTSSSTSGDDGVTSTPFASDEMELVSQFKAPLANSYKSNASIQWRCVHVFSHPDFEAK